MERTNNEKIKEIVSNLDNYDTVIISVKNGAKQQLITKGNPVDIGAMAMQIEKNAAETLDNLPSDQSLALTLKALMDAKEGEDDE